MIFKKTFGNTVFLLAGRLLFRIANAALIIIVARYLGVELYGKFETALAFANVFLIFFDLGMGTLMIREGTKNQAVARVYFGNTLIVETIMTALLYVIMIGTAFAAGYSSEIVTTILILGAALLLFEYRRVCRSVYSILLKMFTPALIETLTGLAVLGAVVMVTLTTNDPKSGIIAIAMAHLIVYGISNVLFLGAALRHIRPQFRWHRIPGMVKESYVFSLGLVFVAVYFQIDQVMLSLLRGSQEVGLYAAAAKFVVFLLFVPRIIYEAALPVLYKFHHEGSDKTKRAFRFMNRYFASLGLPLGIGMMLLDNEIIALLYGQEFLPASTALQVFGWFIMVQFATAGASNILTGIDRQKHKVIIQFSGLGLNIVLNIFLIPRYGFLGAAVASAITETVIGGTLMLFATKFAKAQVWRDWASYLKIFAASVVLSGVIVTLQNNIHIIGITILGAGLYALTLLALKFITPYDKKLFGQLMKRAR